MNPSVLKVREYDGKIEKILLQKKDVFANFDVNLNVLYSDERKISKKKYDDLQYLLRFVPTEFHAFYNTLKYDSDDVEKDYAFSARQSSDEEELS